ncbi:MAG: helix-turn-helix domain-containing protein [Gemmatimonadaceae bacterium]|nr:helix-turn-helix domain-containing protein [Gemmatimonadaceae bacterium]
MTILALLPPKLLRHLQFVAGVRRHVVVAASWKHLLEIVANHPVGVVVIDPSTEGAGSLVELEQLFTAYPSIPVLAYVPLTPAAFRAVAELSKVGLEQVVLYSHEDSAERLHVMLDLVRASPLTGRVLQGLRPKLSLLPLTLAKSVEEMFEEPHRYVSAHDLAVTAKLATSRLYRSFHEVDLASPKRLLTAAKLLRGYTYLSDPGHSVQGVSRKLGYRKARLFTDQANEVFGVNPSRLRSHVSDDAAVSRLLEWCAPSRRP